LSTKTRRQKPSSSQRIPKTDHPPTQGRLAKLPQQMVTGSHLGRMIFGTVLLYKWGWRLGMTWKS
jgi:hypothetical protein